MIEPDATPERAPVVIRYGLPLGAVMVFLGLVVAAAFTGTAEWSLAIPTGLVMGGLVVAGVWFDLHRRGIRITAWIDDYWSRDD